MNQPVSNLSEGIYNNARLLCEQLKAYGFTAEITDDIHGDQEYQVRVARDGKTYLEDVLRFESQYDIVSELGKLCRIACFEAAVQELRPRMALVGWNFTIDKERGQEPNLCIREVGKTTRYNCTYSALTTLRRDLDLAEVAFYMEIHMSLFAELGWDIVICDDAYIIHYDSNSITVGFGDVRQAHKAVNTARSQKTFKHISDTV